LALEQIDESVAVHVHEHRGVCLALGGADPPRRGLLGEHEVPLVDVELVRQGAAFERSEVADEHVEIAVVVHVGERDAVAPVQRVTLGDGGGDVVERRLELTGDPCRAERAQQRHGAEDQEEAVEAYGRHSFVAVHGSSILMVPVNRSRLALHPPDGNAQAPRPSRIST
jgi:hypothetical protein